MNKLPAIQFYFGDWKKDANLAMCSLSTRGFWHELLGAMHELGRSGQITGTAQQLGRVCRCTAAEAEDAIKELRMTKAADVSERDGVYTLINRRMKRESDDRKSTNERVARHRKGGNVTNGNVNVTGGKNQVNKGDKSVKRKSNGNVTPLSSSSTSNTVTTLSSSDEKERGGGGKSPPAAANSKTEQKLNELQNHYSQLDVRKVREKYLKFCSDNNKEPKWEIFEKNWLQTEYTPMDAGEPTSSEIVDYSKCPDCLGTGMITINRKDAKICTHTKLTGHDST